MFKSNIGGYKVFMVFRNVTTAQYIVFSTRRIFLMLVVRTTFLKLKTFCILWIFDKKTWPT